MPSSSFILKAGAVLSALSSSTLAHKHNPAPSYPAGYGSSSATTTPCTSTTHTAYGYTSSSTPVAYGYDYSSSKPADYDTGSKTSTPCTTSTPAAYGYPSSSPAGYPYSSPAADYASEYAPEYSSAVEDYASEYAPEYTSTEMEYPTETPPSYEATSTPCTTSTPAAYGYPSSYPAGYAYSSSAVDYASEYAHEYSSTVEGYEATSTPCTTSTPDAYGYPSSAVDYASEYAHEYSSTVEEYEATSTPCTTSTAVYYEASSVPSYETKVSTHVAYEPYTTKPAESTYIHKPKVYSHIITATYTRTYVDICSTGYTTKTTTQTVEYNPKTTTDVYTTAPPPGLIITTKVCTACAATPVTVTLTVPCETTSTYVKPTPPVVYSKPPPAGETPISYTYCKTCTNLSPTAPSNGHEHVHKTYPVAPTPYVDDSTSTLYQTKMSTVYLAPSPAPPSYKSSLVPPPCVGEGCKPTVPSPQKPYPTAATNVYQNDHVTLSYGTATGSAYVPSKTYSSQMPYFTGGAGSMRVGGVVVGGVVAAVAMVL